ncbi:hypothetical protein P692DRAFT_20839869 [Suillus brevipes Sb2]|nr:hypothetical protein P692DRAFT_20839869 [Suillus brevipes Sb2]
MHNDDTQAAHPIKPPKTRASNQTHPNPKPNGNGRHHPNLPLSITIMITGTAHPRGLVFPMCCGRTSRHTHTYTFYCFLCFYILPFFPSLHRRYQAQLQVC